MAEVAGAECSGEEGEQIRVGFFPLVVVVVDTVVGFCNRLLDGGRPFVIGSDPVLPAHLTGVEKVSC